MEKSDNVEQIPGPGILSDSCLRFGDVDNTIVLSEKDFHDVYQEALDVKANYYQLGIGLKLPLRELDAIRKGFSHDLNQAFIEILLAWLRHRYDVSKYGPPTWRRLVEAIDSPAGGCNSALARSIACNHPASSSVAYMKQVQDHTTVVWVPDQHASVCMCCSKTEFNLFNRRHHCRRCGYVVCSICSSQKFLLSSSSKPQRVCVSCYTELTDNAHQLLDTKRHYHQSADCMSVVSIKAILDNQEELKPSTISECSNIPQLGDSPPLFKRGKKMLASYYLRKIDERAWPPVKAMNFIQLSLVKDQATWRRTVQASVDALVGDKKCVSYHEVFAGIDLSRSSDTSGGNPNLVLLQGRPGSGKTTLMTKISKDWANGDILQSKLLLFIYLRQFNANGDHTLPGIIQEACPTLSAVDCVALGEMCAEEGGKNIVFAFDGLDEYSSKYDDIVFEIIKGCELPDATVLVSSRPAACTNFRRFAVKEIEVVGFLKEHVIEYIFCYFKDNKGKANQLIKHMEQHPNLMNMAYLPLHCAMLAFVYEEETVLYETETDFYKHFTLSTLLRSIRKRKGFDQCFILSSYKDLSSHDKKLFDVICKLAFDATVALKQVFSFSELKKRLFEVDSTGSDESSLGLVVIDRYFMKFGLDETYTFLHLTFQEYLAAVHIAGLDHRARLNIIEDYPEMSTVVWRFLCGMMDFSSKNVIETFDTLLEQTVDVLSQIMYGYESQHCQACTCVIKYNKGHFEFENFLSALDLNAIGNVINKAQYGTVHLLFCEMCVFRTEGAISFLQQVNHHSFSVKFMNIKVLQSFMEALALCPTSGLQALDLGALHIDGCGVSAISNAASSFINLQKLCLDGTKLADSDIILLSAALMQMKSLHTLLLNHNYIGDSGAVSLADAIKEMNNLHVMNLNANNIGDEGFEAISTSLKTKTKLQKIFIMNNKCGLKGAVALSSALRVCEKEPILILKVVSTIRATLIQLHLSNNILGDDGVIALSAALKMATKLQELYLAGNGIGDEGAVALSGAMRTMGDLQQLDLKNNKIGDVGARAISAAISRKARQVSQLNLSDNYIEDSGAISVSNIEIHKLDLMMDFNPISARGQNALRQAVTQSMCEERTLSNTKRLSTYKEDTDDMGDMNEIRYQDLGDVDHTCNIEYTDDDEYAEAKTQRFVTMSVVSMREHTEYN